MKRTSILLMLALWACTDEGGRAPELDQAGDPCRVAQASCVDELTARECIDGVWTDRTCEESCAERGPAMLSEGCGFDPVEGCVCVPEPGFCAPGELTCESETELALCDDSQVWVVYNCVDVCAQTLATPMSMGCSLDEDGVAACWCVAEG